LSTPVERIGISVSAANRPGTLRDLTTIIAAHAGNISRSNLSKPAIPPSPAPTSKSSCPAIPRNFSPTQRPRRRSLATAEKSLQKIYGKRIIIVGGGAQVGQVALGAISEADRHNIRGEHISVAPSLWSASRPLPTPSAPSPACPAPAPLSWPAR